MIRLPLQCSLGTAMEFANKFKVDKSRQHPSDRSKIAKLSRPTHGLQSRSGPSRFAAGGAGSSCIFRCSQCQQLTVLRRSKRTGQSQSLDGGQQCAGVCVVCVSSKLPTSSRPTTGQEQSPGGLAASSSLIAAERRSHFIIPNGQIRINTKLF